ncbi:MAG: phosphoribosylglycinamide formyltransferase, partial [Gammaproteobacteria bacterium]|nr:phosphoribosylglycinamide formyltransferase [Gammaproteobacteria bacterium]
MRTVVLVSGSGSNLQAIIDHARSGGLGVRLHSVISDRPNVLALERARRANIPALTIDHAQAGSSAAFQQQLGEALAELEPQLVVLAGFMRILSPAVVSAWEGRMLNVHPSLLPKYPGLHTYRRALEAGDSVHGSTVHFVIPELDAGPGILQYRVRIRPGDSEDSLRARVQQGEYLIYPRAIAWFAAGRLALKDGSTWLDGERRSAPVVVEEVF